MRRLVLAPLLVVLLAASSGASPDADGAALRTRVQQLVEMMATGDAGSKASAADQLVRLGLPAVREVSRFAHVFAKAEDRDFVAAALARIGVDQSIALILAHPAPQSLNATIAATYCDVMEAMGHEVVRRNLYAMRFDPCLKASELGGPPGAGVASMIDGVRGGPGDLGHLGLLPATGMHRGD